jgi:hypothetical protein
MKRLFIAVLALCIIFAVPGCRNNKNSVEDIPYVPESDPLSVLPEVVDDETDAEIYEVPTPEPRQDKNGETVYPIYYGGGGARRPLQKAERNGKAGCRILLLRLHPGCMMTRILC